MVNDKIMWMVRAGEEAYLIEEFKNKNIVAIGWNEVGDLTNVKNIEGIKRLVRDKNPEYKDGKINITAGQLLRFRVDFEKGDKVVSYDPARRIYLVGEIISDYRFDPKLRDKYHVREVKWFGEVDRDKLSVSTKNTLGAISTIFDVGKEAEEEITRLLEGKEKILRELRDQGNYEEDRLKEDMLSKAHEFVKDKILALDWDEMQELVAGLLRGMGYKTIVSPKGSDRGRDIQASRDGLGLEEPRIKAEVKHRSGQIGAQEVRSFTGGLRPGDKGLYISTGGFTKDARYEAERSNIPVTLIDSDMLVQLIIQYYDNFDTDTKSLLPLIKIYWPT